MDGNAWIVMSKDRKLVAKGIPRDRYLTTVEEGSNKRMLTYTSKARAENSFEGSGFYFTPDAEEYLKRELGDDWYDYRSILEAVKVRIIYKEIDTDSGGDC